MTPIGMRARRGVTLVELLVVMAIMTALAALALMIAPGIANQDNTLKGTADVQAALRISQGMAAAAKIPRGVRLLSPSSTAPAGSSMVTELQYLESPPVFVPIPNVMVGAVSDSSRPQVHFNYFLNGTGAVQQRECHILNLTAEQAAQVVAGSTLVLPTLNFFAQIQSVTPPPANSTSVLVTLAVYPDSILGAAGLLHNTAHTPCYQTFYFGIYGPPRPLLGEPTIELPLNIGIDLTVCQPIGTSGTNYDIMFAPSGQRIATTSVPGSGNQVFLWVRDYTKTATMTPPSFTPPPPPATATSYASVSPNSWIFHQLQFLQGGEQQIVGVRAAAIGSAPVLWPAFSGGNGTYTTTTDPYSLARDKLTGQ